MDFWIFCPALSISDMPLFTLSNSSPSSEIEVACDVISFFNSLIFAFDFSLSLSPKSYKSLVLEDTSANP